jgi:hypothetical protein
MVGATAAGMREWRGPARLLAGGGPARPTARPGWAPPAPLASLVLLVLLVLPALPTPPTLSATWRPEAGPEWGDRVPG